MKSKSKNRTAAQVITYALLLLLAVIMLVPFVWMISASLKQNKDIFVIPYEWFTKNPRWQNYVDIWKKIPLATFTLNTVKLTLIVTFLQILTSSFAAYAFSKLHFKGRNTLFLCYVATIAVPWQVYMVPQFIFMRRLGLADTHLAIIILQAFSAFGVFMMRQYLQTFPDDFVFQGPKESVRRQIGMAVPCEGAQQIFAAVLKTFGGVPYAHVDCNIDLNKL